MAPTGGMLRTGPRLQVGHIHAESGGRWQNIEDISLADTKEIGPFFLGTLWQSCSCRTALHNFEGNYWLQMSLFVILSCCVRINRGSSKLQK